MGQFRRVLTAGPLPAMAYEQIAKALTENEQALFERLGIQDQWHAYRVLQTLENAGHTQSNLHAAALLHDVGKSKFPLSIWERTLIVLAQAFIPRLVAAWGEGDPRGWKRPFVVKAKHPSWGAEMAIQAGSAPMTIALISRHQEPLKGNDAGSENELLRLLQWADDVN